MKSIMRKPFVLVMNVYLIKSLAAGNKVTHEGDCMYTAGLKIKKYTHTQLHTQIHRYIYILYPNTYTSYILIYSSTYIKNPGL